MSHKVLGERVVTGASQIILTLSFLLQLNSPKGYTYFVPFAIFYFFYTDHLRGLKKCS